MNPVFRALIASAFLLGLNSVAADKPQRPVLVELFSSQGCNSCPSAEEFLRGALKDTALKNTVVLSWHVDYWDYLGWRDTWASRATTERQRQYLRTLKLSTLVTPQFFVNGKPLAGANTLLDRVKAAQSEAVIGIDLSVSVNASEVRAEFQLERIDNEIKWPDSLQVLPVLFQREGQVKPTAGENNGTHLHGVNIVRALGEPIPAQRATSHKITTVFSIPDGLDAANVGVAVLVQDAATLRPYACAVSPVKP